MAQDDQPVSGSQGAVPDRFDSFDLSIERIDKTYRGVVTRSPAGQTPAVKIESSRLRAGTRARATDAGTSRDVRRRPVDHQDLRHVGERLFRAVFVREIAECFRASTERTRSQGVGLRIRLQLDEAPELAALPWEALWDPSEQAFLNDLPDLPVTRALRIRGRASVPGPEEPPLRLLALLPEPTGESKLSGVKEWQGIEEQLAPLIRQGTVETDRLEPATLAGLRRHLDDVPCDVLHIVAHGGRGEPGAGGSLKLESSTGGLDSVSGGDLARALEHRIPPRLVVLNACHGACATVDDAFDGMAQRLISRGVPAVVAMRTSISDAAAVSFAAALYRGLAQGRTIEGAMVEARRKISLGEHRTEWATPVLYLRGDNVRIFETDTAVQVVRRPRKHVSRAVGGALASLVTAWLGLWAWTGLTDDSFAPPLGLQDLRFVDIEPGVAPGDEALVVIEAFQISTKEVSHRDWVAAMGADWYRPDWAPNRPMTHVTPDDVEEFLRRLSERDPTASYQLPTETQWKYAARAGQETAYHFGDDPSQLHKYGNCRNRDAQDGYEGVAPIGSYKPNSWGLYDVHGNVAEWVRWPEDEEPPRDELGRERGLRLGGSFDSAPSTCSFSFKQTAVLVTGSRNQATTGIRVVRVMKGTSTGS